MFPSFSMSLNLKILFVFKLQFSKYCKISNAYGNYHLCE